MKLRVIWVVSLGNMYYSKKYYIKIILLNLYVEMFFIIYVLLYKL